MSITKGLNPKGVWEYVKRTLTNLPDSRANLIDNLDKRISSLNDISVSDVDNVISQYIMKVGYLYDDFRDNKYSSRDMILISSNRTLKQLLPEWNVKSGSPSVANQQLILPTGNSTEQRVSVVSGITTATWEFKFKHNATPTTGKIRFYIMYEDANNYYALVFDKSDNNLKLIKNQGGTESTLISTKYYGLYNPVLFQEIKITRNSYGDWELFVNNASKGTATDTWLPETKTIEISNTTDVTVYIDYIKVY